MPEVAVRSDLVHAAMKYVPSRYLLVNTASKAARLFHRPHTQVSETVNEVLCFFHHHNPVIEQTSETEYQGTTDGGIVAQFDMRY